MTYADNLAVQPLYYLLFNPQFSNIICSKLPFLLDWLKLTLFLMWLACVCSTHLFLVLNCPAVNLCKSIAYFSIDYLKS